MYKERGSLEQFDSRWTCQWVFPDPKMRSNDLEFILLNSQSTRFVAWSSQKTVSV